MTRARPRPALVIELRLEAAQGVLVLDCESHEDELRLRSWLRRSRAFQELPRLLEVLLDQLDELDGEHAA